MPSSSTPPATPAPPLGENQRAGARSESLLPAAPDDDAGDGRYTVAEEVSVDQQSALARRIGQAPADPTRARAIADALGSGNAPPMNTPRQDRQQPQEAAQDRPQVAATPRDRLHDHGPMQSHEPDRTP